jgi:hypothetical protein
MMRWNVLKLNGISWNVSQCGDMGMVGKYPKQVPKYSNYVTQLGQLVHLPAQAHQGGGIACAPRQPR